MRTKKSIINSILGVVFLVISTLLAFILSRSFIDNLGLEFNGINGVFSNIISILSITELGIAGSISFALYKPIYEKDTKKISMLMNFFRNSYRVIGVVVICLSVLISFFVPLLIKDFTLNINYIRFVFLVFSINSTISYFFAYNRTLMYANQNNYYVSIVDFGIKVFKTFFQLYLLNKYQNYLLFLIVNILFTFTNNLIIHIWTNKKYPEIDLKKYSIDDKTKKEVYSTIKSLAIIQIMSISINFTDNIIISSIMGVNVAGLFVNYNLVYTQLISAISVLFNGIGASLGNLLAENNRKRISEVMYNYEYLGFFVALICSVSLALLMQPFIANIWLSSNYLLSDTFLYIMVCNLYLLINRQTINYYLRLSGNYNDSIFPIIIEAIVNIFVSIILAIKIGIEGVVIGTVISSIIGFILSAKRYNKHIYQKNYTYFFRQIYFLLITILSLVFSNVIHDLFIISNPYVSFVVLLSVCLTVSIAIIIGFVLSNKQLDIFRKVLFKFLKKRCYYENK